MFNSLVWLDPEKIPPQAGFEPGTFRSRGGRLNHLANEAVYAEDNNIVWTGSLVKMMRMHFKLVIEDDITK